MGSLSAICSIGRMASIGETQKDGLIFIAYLWYSSIKSKIPLCICSKIKGSFNENWKESRIMTDRMQGEDDRCLIHGQRASDLWWNFLEISCGTIGSCFPWVNYVVTVGSIINICILTLVLPLTIKALCLINEKFLLCCMIWIYTDDSQPNRTLSIGLWYKT